MTNTPVFPQTLVNTAAQITSGTGSGIANAVTIRSGSLNGDKIESIAVTSTDYSGRVLTLVATRGGTDYRLGTASIPSGAGTNAAITPSVSFLEPSPILAWVRQDQNGRPYMYLDSGTILKVYTQSVLSPNTEIDIFTQIGAY